MTDTDPRIRVVAAAIAGQYRAAPDPALWARDAAVVVDALDAFEADTPALSDDDDPRVAAVDAILRHRFRRRSDANILAGVARQVVAAIDWHTDNVDDEIGADDRPVVECTVVANATLSRLLVFAYLGVDALGGAPDNPGYLDDEKFLGRVCAEAGLDGYTVLPSGVADDAS